MARQDVFIIGGVRIASIEDLYDNFDFGALKRCIESGKLQFWLRAKGYEAEAAAVEKLDLAAPDADLLLLAALNAPEDKRDAILARKREEQEKAGAAELERANRHLAVVKGLVLSLVELYQDNDRNLEYSWRIDVSVGNCPPSVADDIKPIIARELKTYESWIRYGSKLATYGAEGEKLKSLCRVLGDEKRVTFTQSDISKMKTVGDLAKTLYYRMIPLACLRDAPQPIAGYRRWVLFRTLQGFLCQQLDVPKEHYRDIRIDSKFAERNRYSENLICATPGDIKAVCDRLSEALVITIPEEEIAAVKGVEDILDVLEREMVTDTVPGGLKREVEAELKRKTPVPQEPGPESPEPSPARPAKKKQGPEPELPDPSTAGPKPWIDAGDVAATVAVGLTTLVGTPFNPLAWMCLGSRVLGKIKK